MRLTSVQAMRLTSAPPTPPIGPDPDDPVGIGTPTPAPAPDQGTSPDDWHVDPQRPSGPGPDPDDPVGIGSSGQDSDSGSSSWDPDDPTGSSGGNWF